VTPAIQKSKVLIGIILAFAWVCSFLFISSTLIIDFGGGVTVNFKLVVVLVGLLVLFFYHLLYPSNAETTKLSWTAVYTVAWLSLMFFYPFKDLNVDEGTRGAVAFFALVGGLLVCLLWVRFFSDEIVA